MQTEAIDKSGPKNQDKPGPFPGAYGKKQRRRGNKKAPSGDDLTGTVNSSNIKKNRRNRVKKSSDLSKLNLPQLKIVLRCVGDVERHGTIEKMVSLIRDLIEVANMGMTQGVSGTNLIHSSKDEECYIPLVLDEDSIENVLAAQVSSETIMENEGKEITALPSSSNTADVRDIHSSFDIKSNTVHQESQNMGNTAIVRLLYVIPTRKSRRRGEIPGRAYLLLQPPLPSHIIEKVNANRCLDESSERIDSNYITPTDRSIAISQSRTTLNCCLHRLEEILSADSLNEQRFRRSRIEQCLNNKTWKLAKSGSVASNYYSRMDSTLESSDDYNLFLQNRAKLEEERLSRPKPIAGGLAVTDAIGAHGQGNITENGMPISAILLHLRSKREKASKKRRESAKPKSNGTSVRPDKDSNSAKDQNLKRKPKGSSSRDKGIMKESKPAVVNSASIALKTKAAPNT